jgi:3-hydroxyisobutyrate dehydrogenase
MLAGAPFNPRGKGETDGGRAWQAAKLRRIADGDFSAQFALSLALKDVHLALQAAGDGQFAVLACLADEWQQAVDQGLGGQDLTVVERTIG